MAYKISSKKYLRQREIDYYKKEKKKSLYKEGVKFSLGYPEKIHKKGEIVEYENGYAKIKKVTKKGVYVRVLRYEGDKFSYIEKKDRFIPESEWRKNARPMANPVLSYPFIFITGRKK